MNKISKLVISILLPAAAGTIGSLFTFSAIPTWYAALTKPAFGPPNWLFGPVWTILYLMMGIAMFLVWQKAKAVKPYLRVFIIQLILNALWSIVFFGQQNPGLAFVVIVALWLAILWNIILFLRVSKTAGWLLVPYLLWVSFASILNYSIFALNR